MRRWAELIVVLAVLTLVCGALAQETKVHVVKKGDTLWDLSGYYLTNPFLWPDIYEVNKLKINDPHWIYPGQEFVIPPVIPTDVEGSGTRNYMCTRLKRPANNFDIEILQSLIFIRRLTETNSLCHCEGAKRRVYPRESPSWPITGGQSSIQ